MTYYLGIDIGASGGRHILGHLEAGQLKLEEVYRFDNGLISVDGTLCWDTDRLFKEIIAGMKVCKSMDKKPTYLGIDTWGVDFVLVDDQGGRVGQTVAYRDKRTAGMDKILEEHISLRALYERTGIQKQDFNTIYQLLSMKVHEPEVLKEASYFLMMPDYFNYLLTGKLANEYTNATTTQLVNVKSYQWDRALTSWLGCDHLMKDIKMPGDKLGILKQEIVAQVGFDCEVLHVASHDTASAVMAVPSQAEDTMYISSGTWSLMGTLNQKPNTSQASQEQNFTNSGGYDHEILFLKNIMGLWMIQEVSRIYGHQYTYSQWCEMASESTMESIVDCKSQAFLSPASMVEAIQEACKQTGQAVPENPADIAAVVYNSLAASYSDTKSAFERLNGNVIKTIQIVGGGSQADYLNQKTADVTGCPVTAGPIEGTAIGNILCQMMASGEIESMVQAKEVIQSSFDLKYYQPTGNANNRRRT